MTRSRSRWFAAVGVDFFTRLASGELDPADLDNGDSPFGWRG